MGLVVLVVVLLVMIVAGISLTTYFYNLHLLEVGKGQEGKGESELAGILLLLS